VQRMSDAPGRIETLLAEREWVRALARSLVADGRFEIGTLDAGAADAVLREE